MKYKSDIYEHATPTCGVFVSTTTVTSGSINGVGADGVYHSIIENDTATAGSWHYLVVDLTDGRTTVVEDGGKYTIDYVRISGFDGNGSQVDIAYMAFGDDLANLVASVSKYDESFDTIMAAECAHPVDTYTIEQNDADTHTVICGVCGDTVGNQAHTVGASEWSESAQCYVASCSDCGEQFNAMGILVLNAQQLAQGSGYNTTVEYISATDVARNTKTGGGCRFMAITNGTSVGGRYVIVKYRIENYVYDGNKAIGIAASTTATSLVNGSHIEYYTLGVEDGSWGYMVFDLEDTEAGTNNNAAQVTPNGDGDYIITALSFGGYDGTGTAVDYQYVVMGDDLAKLVTAIKTLDEDATNLTATISPLW